MNTQPKPTQKQLYEQKIKAQLDQWNARIDELKAKAAQKDAEARLDYQNQIEELQAKRDAFEQKLQDLQKSSEDAWEEISQGVEKAWNELGKSFEAAFSKFK